jgi:CBS domain-containing protein
MKKLLVKDCMSRDLKKVEYGETVEKVSMEIIKHNVSSILVSRNNSIVGIITETDIFNNVLGKNKRPSEVPVQDIMSSPIETISEDASADEASAKIREKGVKKLLVMKGNKPVGIVTIADLTKKTVTVQKEKFDGWAKGIFDAWNAF